MSPTQAEIEAKARELHRAWAKAFHSSYMWTEISSANKAGWLATARHVLGVPEETLEEKAGRAVSDVLWHCDWSTSSPEHKATCIAAAKAAREVKE